MKILQLIQKSQLRGAELFASQLSNHLLDNDHDVKMICLLDGDAKLPFKGEIIRLKRSLSQRFIDIDGWRMLAYEIKKFEPDIIQANAGDTLKFAVFSKLFFRWKTPIIFRNANKVSDFINTRPKKWLNKFLVNCVEHVISVSELCRTDFIKTYSYPVHKVTTVPIGIDIKNVNSELPSDLITFFHNSKVLINVASLVPEKNQLALIRMMGEIVKIRKDVKLILVGDGKRKSEITKSIESYNLDKHVLVAGYRNDVMSITQHANAFVLPSLIEGLPGVILEAQYCKVPVIAYDVGGISEVVENGKTGWLVEKNNETDFILKTCTVLNEENTEKLIENSYHQVIQHYDNRMIAIKFLNIYLRIALPFKKIR